MAFLLPLEGRDTIAESILTRELRFRLFIALDVGRYVLGCACVGVLRDNWLGEEFDWA